MTTLNYTQLILLSTAACRDSGSFYPLPDTLGQQGRGVPKVIDALLKRRLAIVRETSDKASIYRVDGDAGFGVFITDAGSQAINAAEAPASASSPSPSPTPAAEVPPPTTTRVTKTNEIVALLRRDSGATLAELIEATGWLPHTTRAALTGLRKKGHVIERSKRGTDTCYCMKAA